MSTNANEILKSLTGGRLTLGKAVRSIRLTSGKKPGPFARQLGISQTYLNDLESDHKEVTTQKAVELATALDYPEQEFIRLAIQDNLARHGWEFEVKLKPVD